MRRHRAEKHHNRHEKFKPEKHYVGHFCATNCRMICNVPIVAILYPDQRYLILIVAGRRRAPRLHWRGGGGGEDTQKLGQGGQGQGGGEDTEKLPHQAASQLPHQTPRFPNRTTQHSELAPPSLLSSNPILPRLPKPFSYLSHGQPWLAALVLVILLVPAGQYHTLPLLLLSIVLSLVSPELKVVEVIFWSWPELFCPNARHPWITWQNQLACHDNESTWIMSHKIFLTTALNPVDRTTCISRPSSAIVSHCRQSQSSGTWSSGSGRLSTPLAPRLTLTGPTASFQARCRLPSKGVSISIMSTSQRPAHLWEHHIKTTNDCKSL